MSVSTFHLIYAGVLGLLVGSFLNVVILRLPPYLMWNWKRDAHQFLGSSWAFEEAQPPGIAVKRSFCPKCHHQLSWWENIPLFSFILLKGKCRSCANPISWQYPLVEAAMGALAVLSVYHFGWNLNGLLAASLAAVLIVCAGIDFRTQLLPDVIVLPMIWIGLLVALTSHGFVSLPQSVIGAVVGYMTLWSIFWLFKIITGKEGMGYGDFKLLAMLGAFFGPLSLVSILLLACVVGSVVGVALLKIKKESQPFAFGPYLALGGLVYLFAGNWMTSFIL